MTLHESTDYKIEIGTVVRVTNPFRRQYLNRFGVVEKLDTRKPTSNWTEGPDNYVGVTFSEGTRGRSHVVWFFVDELDKEKKRVP